ncbi:sigma-70 family RNA polymerase sigma factor [Aestuariimicrobium kwangyangense]|uniref:sigma-70 family RNA polymerase sigma factor n=1 Tax=Aestuariimicrobium kwangyangense TaxID=396389 RepID=UPI0003B2E6E4|nr:sigma-70 family RNA polymerase sigma factor [Aestuariimicrobium kwangyangense]
MTNTRPTRSALLSADEEIDLARTIEAGVLARAALDGDFDTDAPLDDLRALTVAGDEAWQRMWQANVGLAGMLAGRVSRRHGLPEDDLVSEAQLGLAEAIMRWDHRRGTRFSTTAWIWITSRLQRAQRDLFTQRDELRNAIDLPELVSDETVDEQILDEQPPAWLDDLPVRERTLLQLLARPDATPARVRAQLGLSRSAYHRLVQRARELAAVAWKSAA